MGKYLAVVLLVCLAVPVAAGGLGDSRLDAVVLALEANHKKSFLDPQVALALGLVREPERLPSWSKGFWQPNPDVQWRVDVLDRGERIVFTVTRGTDVTAYLTDHTGIWRWAVATKDHGRLGVITPTDENLDRYFSEKAWWIVWATTRVACKHR